MRAAVAVSAFLVVGACAAAAGALSSTGHLCAVWELRTVMLLSAINRDFEPRRSERPDFGAVAAAIHGLDGFERTLVTLEINDEHHMGIGGGDGRYIVYMTADNLRFKNLVIPGRSGPKVSLICGGQQGDFAAKQSIDLPTACKAAQTFAMTGQPDPGLHWEDG